MLKLVAYAANTGVLPDDASIPEDDRWSMTDSPDKPAPPGTTIATITPEGILHISDPDVHAHRIYARYDTLNSTDDAIFEINCQLTSSGASNGIEFGFVDTEKMLQVVLFSAGEIAVSVKGAVGARTAAFTTNDKFHTYRIVKTGAVKMEVYADGMLVLDIPYNQLDDRTTDFSEPRQCVATSGSELSEWDIAYVSYSISP